MRKKTTKAENKEWRKERLAKARKYREDHPNYYADYRKKNKTKIAKYQKEWSRTHREVKMKNKLGRPKKRGPYNKVNFTAYCRENCYDKKKVIAKLVKQWLSERRDK